MTVEEVVCVVRAVEVVVEVRVAVSVVDIVVVVGTRIVEVTLV